MLANEDTLNCFPVCICLLTRDFMLISFIPQNYFNGWMLQPLSPLGSGGNQAFSSIISLPCLQMYTEHFLHKLNEKLPILEEDACTNNKQKALQSWCSSLELISSSTITYFLQCQNIVLTPCLFFRPNLRYVFLVQDLVRDSINLVYMTQG